MPSTPPASRNSSSQSTTEREGTQGPGVISPQLIDEVTAKVYAMLLLELKIERERQRFLTPRR